MQTKKRKVRKGLALPVILMVVSILVLVGGGVATLSAGGVNASRRDALGERALYAAEAGLANATNQLMDGEVTNFSGTLASGDATYEVKFFKNETGTPMSIPNGPTIPPGTMLLVSTGTTREQVSRQSWALFKLGLGNFDVGALAEDQLVARNSTLKAYNSDNDQEVPNAPVVACNNSTGWTYILDNTQVKGSAFTYGTANMDLQNGSAVTRKATMKNKINPNTKAVPTLPPAGSDPSATPDPTPTPIVEAMAVNNQYIFNPPNANGELFIEKNCLDCWVKPDGSFRAVETGNGKWIEGNLKTGQITRNDNGNWTLEGTPPQFSVRGQWHSVGFDPTTGNWGHDKYTSNVENQPTQWNPAPAWVQAFMGAASAPPSVNDPAVLTTGTYDTVTINSGSTTQIQPNSQVVIKNLIVNNGGKLRLPNTTDKTEIFVTNKLSIRGTDALVNDAEKAPLLTIWYSGNQKVEMAGGAKAYATVYAPGAQVELTGAGSAFFGALVGKSVIIDNATFTYDIATSGVGEGVDGSAVDVIARYRP